MSSLETEQKTAVVVERLTEYQSALYVYICSLTADFNLAWDILQETNRVIWKHATEYEVDKAFLPWARAFAFNQVRAARKKNQRDRLIFHDENTLRDLSSQFDESSSTHNDSSRPGEKTVALELCLEGLSSNQRELVDRFYNKSEALNEIATNVGIKANAIAVKLHRIRQRLADCIRRRLNDE